MLASRTQCGRDQQGAAVWLEYSGRPGGYVGEAKENSATGNHCALLLEELNYGVELHIIKMGSSLKFTFLLSFYHENFCAHTEIERYSKPIYTFSRDSSLISILPYFLDYIYFISYVRDSWGFKS